MIEAPTESGKVVSILTLHQKDEPPAHYIFESDLIPITVDDEKNALPILMRELGIDRSPAGIEDHEIDRLENATGISGIPFVDFSGLL